MSVSPQRVPRRFRRRLLAVMLGAGLLPLLALGALGAAGVQRSLSLSPRRLDDVLRRADAAVARSGDARLLAELHEAQISLVQAELARQSLSRLLPAALVAGVAAAAVLLGAAAVALGRALSRPVEELAADMSRIAQGALELPERELSSADRDELQFLHRELRAMARELAEQRRRLAVTEGLAAWREVAQKLAHELKNPLTAMQMALARLGKVERSGPDAERLGESVLQLSEEVAMLLRLTQSFATFAKLPEPQLRPLDLSALLSDVCALYRGAGPVDVQLETAGSLAVNADADQLRRAVGNLIKNALEASPAGGDAVRVQAGGDGSAVRITVSDAGGGIGRAIEGAELTRSLGSTKAAGSGLGLPIAHKIVHDHGGSLRLEPLPKGTRAVIVLPGTPT
jgi:nitrogen fixation/metabolism regulation signal transduction histidine kinase